MCANSRIRTPVRRLKPKVPIAGRVSAEVAAATKRYARLLGITRSEAVGRLIEVGLMRKIDSDER